MRDNKLVESITSTKMRRVVQSAGQAVDDQGRVRAQAAKNIRTPVVFNWLATSGMRQRAPRAGKGILIASHATTAPSSGQLIIRLFQQYPGSGQTQIYTLYHPQGSTSYMYEEEIVPKLDILAGSWLSCDIQSAGGASGVSVSFVMDVG